MDISHSRLLSSIASEGFFDNVYEISPKHFPNLLTPKALQALISLEEFTDIINRNRLFPRTIHVIKNGTVGLHQVTSNNAVVNNVLFQHLTEGDSIRLTCLDDFVKTLRDECLALSRNLGVKTNINGYITPAKNKGFKPHFDCHDVLILQLSGTKIWKLYESYDQPVIDPVEGMYRGPEVHKPHKCENEILMQLGDILYIPRGKMHSAYCQDEHSIHLTFGLEKITASDFFTFLSQHIRTNVKNSRRQLANNFFRDDLDKKAVMSELKSIMNDIFENESVEVIFESFRQMAAVDTLHFPLGDLKRVLNVEKVQYGDYKMVRLDPYAYMSLLATETEVSLFSVVAEMTLSQEDIVFIERLMTRDWSAMSELKKIYKSEKKLLGALKMLDSQGLIQFK